MSCRHEYGRRGAENGPGQGQTQTGTEASVQAWAPELSAHRALGKGSVEPTSKDTIGSRGGLQGTRGSPSFLAWLTTTHPLGPWLRYHFLKAAPRPHCPNMRQTCTLLVAASPVPSTAQYVAHCQPSRHLIGRKER